MGPSPNGHVPVCVVRRYPKLLRIHVLETRRSRWVSTPLEKYNRTYRSRGQDRLRRGLNSQCRQANDLGVRELLLKLLAKLAVRLNGNGGRKGTHGDFVFSFADLLENMTGTLIRRHARVPMRIHPLVWRSISAQPHRHVETLPHCELRHCCVLVAEMSLLLPLAKHLDETGPVERMRT